MLDGSELIMSLNRALLGEVTPNLRAALISKEKSEVHIRFVFYTKPSSDEVESFSAVVGEVIADSNNDETIFESYEVNVRDKIFRTNGEEMVYRRKD